jgi:hypothetical protein
VCASLFNYLSNASGIIFLGFFYDLWLTDLVFCTVRFKEISKIVGLIFLGVSNWVSLVLVLAIQEKYY